MLGTQRNPRAISTFAKLEIVVERPLRKGFEFAALEAPHELQQHKPWDCSQEHAIDATR